MLKLMKIWRPEIYQGKKQMNKYFEGWYFKIVSKDENTLFAVIPGVSYGINGSGCHSFVQVIDGKSCKSHYLTYDIKDFRYSKKDFRLWIGPNYFSSDEVRLDLSSKSVLLKGELSFENAAPWPSSLLSPYIMGWYSFVPFMECYHSVISMNNDIRGSLTVNDKDVDFSGGRGYMEKDWGRSFPSSWIWLQSNHFDEPGVFLTASIARIPWFGRFFTGLIAGISVNGKLYRFATYTGARIELISCLPDGIRIFIRDRQMYLDISARRSNSGKLYSPRNGSMEGIIEESMTAEISLTLGTISTNTRSVLFEGKGRNAGLEIVGDMKDLH